MRTDGRTDMRKLIVPFRNFAKAAQKQRLFPHTYDIGLMFFLYIRDNVYCAVKIGSLNVIQVDIRV